MKGLLWFLTAVWFIGSWYWYVCPHKMVCPWGDYSAKIESPEAKPITPTKKSYGPLTFAWSNPDPFTTNYYTSFRDSIAATLENQDKLVITGKYYADEENNTSFDNLGLARASAIRESFAAAIPKERMDIASELLAGSSANAQADRFSAGSFRRVVTNESVREVEGKMVINFPHASADMLENRELIKYLDDLVVRMKENPDEKINLVGHTDSSAGATTNMRLGMQRAEAIKKILVDKGIAGSRINTSSRGEAQPIASNNTAAGMQENRRVELTIID